MSTEYKAIPVPFNVGLFLLKKGYPLYREKYNGPHQHVKPYMLLNTTVVSYLYLQGSNDKAKLFGWGYGEYQQEPVFADTLNILKGGVVTPYSFTLEDLYAEDYFVMVDVNKENDFYRMILPVMPYGLMSDPS